MFIVTVLEDGITKCCQPYDHFEDAKQAALGVCRGLGLEPNKSLIKEDDLKCWVVYGNDIMAKYYFICIFERTSASWAESIKLPTADINLDMSKYDSEYIEQYGEEYSDDSDYYSEKHDDWFDLNLPGGYNKMTCKPISMEEVYKDPVATIAPGDMTYEQKWALVFARLKHRKNQDYISPDLYLPLNHSELLEEFKNLNSHITKEVVEYEIVRISDMYAEAEENNFLLKDKDWY